MTTTVTRLLAAALAAGVVLLSGSSAQATGETAPGAASITHVESHAKGLQLLVSVPPGSDVDLEGVGVTVDGVQTEATAENADSDVSVERTAILVIDTSNSMKGERFDAARTAAQTYLDTVPDDVQVGIVSFADEVTRALPPTTDRDAAREVLGELTLSPSTHLYDGVEEAVAMAGKDGQRTLLVLSDGRDTSKTALDDVTAGVADQGVLLDVVSVDQEGDGDPALQALASAGSGRVITADADALEREFAKEAEVLSRQIVVKAELPDTVTSRSATVEVTLEATPSTLTAEAFAPVRSARDDSAQQDRAAPVASSTGSVALPTTWMFAGVGALGLGLLGLLVLLVPRPAPQLTPGERAAIYTDRVVGRHAGPARPEHDQALGQAKDAAAKVLQRNKTLEARISRRLEAAGSSLKPAEWLLVHAGIFLGAGAVGMLLGKGSFLLALLFLVLGVIGPWIYLGVRRGRRRKAFSTSLPDTLQLMSGSLAAGLSLAQSVDTIVREGTEPIASEFKRVLVEMRLGVSLEDALGDVAARYDSKDFGWVVMAIKIQRQVGGNLAELLDSVAATMREREYMRRQVSALAAEGKLSAWVLGGLPPVFMLYLLLTNRDYVSVMFHDPIGWLMLGAACLLLTIGVFWMSRLVKVEV